MSSNVDNGDFHHHSPEYSANKFPILNALCSASSNTHLKKHNGFWVVTSYQLTNSTQASPDAFSSLKKEGGSNCIAIPSVGLRTLSIETNTSLHNRPRPMSALDSNCQL